MSSNKTKYISLLIIVAMQLSHSLFAGEDLKLKAAQYFSQTHQLGFKENKGQMLDSDGKPASSVLYKVEVPNLNVWITTSGLTYQFLKFEDEEKTEGQAETRDEHKALWHRVDMILTDAQIKKENIITDGDISQGEENYYLEHSPNGIFNVKTVTKITIKDVYEGIDWVLYTNNGIAGSSLKQDFIVHPNANPNRIKLIYEGSGRLEVKNNQIHFENEIGEIQEGKLFCYQGNEEVKSNYTIKKNQELRIKNQEAHQQQFSYEIGIQLNEYDKSKELIIDPQLVWATFYGGNAADGPMSIATDNNGSIFITGYTITTVFPLLNAGGTSHYQGVYAGGSSETFILKFSNNGQRLWATYYGGALYEKAYSICTDPTGNVFVTGATDSPLFPLLNGGGTSYNQPIYGGGNSDVYILKFSNAGQRLWATFYGGSGDENGHSICTDAAGTVFVTGLTNSANFPFLNSGAGAYYQTVLGGSFDNFIAKFANNGQQIWSTLYGGNQDDKAFAICSDVIGNIFITGYSGSSNLPLINVAGSFNQSVNQGSNDGFISKFSNAGVHLWASFYGGTSSDYPYSICADNVGNVYIAGKTESANFPVFNPGGGAYFQGVYGGGSIFGGDAFIVKFSNVGAQLWATYYGGSLNEQIYTYDNLATDSCNNVYFSFSTFSTNIAVTAATGCPNEFSDVTIGGTRDKFIVKFNAAGKSLWANYLGGDGTDFGEAVAVDNNDNLFITGEWTAVTTSSTYPLMNPGGTAYYDATQNGQDEGHVLKFIQTPPSFTQSQVNTIGCSGCNGSATITLSCGTPNYSYVWSNSSQTLNDTSNTNTISNLCAGTYTVTATSNCNQSVTATFTITGSGGPPIVTSQNISICTGQNFTLPGGTIINTSGSYIDTVLASNGCDSIITTNVTITNTITSSQSPVICTGQNFTLPGGTIVSAAGIFTDTINSFGGCDSVITTTLTVNPPFAITQNPVICKGQTFTLPNTNIVDSSGTYIDTLQTTSGCDSIITTNLTITPALTVTQNPIICTGTNFTLPDGSIVNTGGSYTDTIATTNGCDSIITTNLTVKPNSSSSQSASICAGASYTLPSGTVVSTAGVYPDTINSSNGCDSIITVTLTNALAPNVNASPLTIPCTQTSGTITSNSTTPNATYNWSGPGIVSGGATNNPIVNAAGTYTVMITDPITGCTITATTTVTIALGPTAVVSPDITIQYGSSTILTASGGTNYSWTPTTNLNPTTGNAVTASPNQTITYCVEVRDNNGCRDTACVTVSVEMPCPTNESLQVPNAFSPNSDNVNDDFCLQGWDVCIEEFSVIIFNRWGAKVFESQDPNFCWDGYHSGSIMDAQVFVYYLKARVANIEKAIIKKGNISLIR